MLFAKTIVVYIRSPRYKTDELVVVGLLRDNNIDICCVTESWLTAEIRTEAVDLEGCPRYTATTEQMDSRGAASSATFDRI